LTYDLPPELVVEADGSIRTVVINRPEQLNAVNPALHRALANVWRQLSADREARVVILTGAGRTFCAGGDFDWMQSFLTDEAGRYESLREGAEIIEEMLRFPLPVIAAVNGAAIGLGCSLAALCDIVLMSERAHLADPLLTHIMKSREYLFTGDRISAAKAVELGLATRSTTPDDLMPEARRLAERVAQQPPLAVQGTKRVINMHLSRALSGAVQAGFATEEITMQSDEHRQRLLQLKPPAPR